MCSKVKVWTTYIFKRYKFLEMKMNIRYEKLGKSHLLNTVNTVKAFERI